MDDQLSPRGGGGHSLGQDSGDSSIDDESTKSGEADTTTVGEEGITLALVEQTVDADDMQVDEGQPVILSTVPGTSGSTLSADGVNLLQFRADASGGLRLVQVGPSQPNVSSSSPHIQTVMKTNGLSQGAGVAGAMMQGSVVTTVAGSDMTSDSSGGRFAFYQTAVHNEATSTTGADSPTLNAQAPGQLYVMMTPEVIHSSPRAIAPRVPPYSMSINEDIDFSSNRKVDGTRTARDQRRRATHNEVERRRRDKINTWISKLAAVIPDCQIENTKSAQTDSQSKGAILAKTVCYIEELVKQLNQLSERVDDLQQYEGQVQLYHTEYEKLQKENANLRTQIQQAGLKPSVSPTPPLETIKCLTTNDTPHNSIIGHSDLETIKVSWESAIQHVKPEEPK